MTVDISKDYAALSKKAAIKTARYINANPDTLICLAAGNTPLGMLHELVAMHDRGEVDLTTVWYAGLDEWTGFGPDDEGSCVKIMYDAIYKHIPADRVKMFDGLDRNNERQCREMENWIVSHGGIGFTLLGIGMNGHIGFNEPGTPDTEGCIIVELDDVTKSVSKKYFGRERPVTTGVTIGLRTLLNAREVVLMASGEEKASIVKASLHGNCVFDAPSDASDDGEVSIPSGVPSETPIATPAEISSDVPASLFRNHDNITVMLDEKAASLL